MRLIHRLFKPGRITAVIVVAVILLGIAAVPVAAQQQTHVVQPGETMASIAARYNTTVDAIAQLNNITNPNYIYRGQVLLIPATGGPTYSGISYTVRRGDELRFIAAYYNTTWQAITQLNNLANPNWIYAGQVLRIPATGGPIVNNPAPVFAGGRYIVQPGDTLYRIAARFGVNIYSIAQANGLLNLNQIYTGQGLIIPGY
jgi:LysM repeat protein